MARPAKVGLEYFPLVTNFEDKIILLIAEFGASAVGIIISLYQKIYDNGYYIDWNNDSLMLFSRYINEEIERVNTVITRCFDRDIFNKELYEKYGILTSHGIQKQFLKVCKEARRKYVSFVKEYCLIKDNDLLSVITELTVVNAEETPVHNSINTEETPVNDSDNTQSKVKESKVKNKDITPEFEKFRTRYFDFIDLIDRYFEILRTTRVSGKISDGIILRVYEEMNKHPPIVVKYACHTIANNPQLHDKKENYFFGILRNTTAEEATRKLNKPEQPKGKAPQAGNFEQRKYDDEYYEGFYKNTAGAK